MQVGRSDLLRVGQWPADASSPLRRGFLFPLVKIEEPASPQPQSILPWICSSNRLALSDDGGTPGPAVGPRTCAGLAKRLLPLSRCR